MAIGDVVSALSAANTILDFQPAAGVEVAVKQVNSLVANFPSLTDGVLIGLHTGLIDSGFYYSMSMMLNNAIHYTSGALGPGNSSAFSGIQIA